MKKNVKRIGMGLIALAMVSLAVYKLTMPKYVETFTVAPKTAELYFVETGEVVADGTVDVYSLNTGELLNIYVEEGDEVKQGDVICEIDPWSYQNMILRLEGGIRGYEAQIINLSVEESKQRDDQSTNKENLEAQMRALAAQENSTSISREEQDNLNNEQIRLQNLIIQQSQKNVQIEEENLEKIRILYENGAVPENDYHAAEQSLEGARDILNQNEQQLSLIQNIEQGNSTEYYSAMKEALQVQVNGINKTMNKTYTGPMAQYYASLIEVDRLTIEQLKKNIADCTITAPISGVIANLPVKHTNMLTNLQPVATIHSTEDNHIEALVNTNDIDYVEKGMQVELILRRRDGDKLLTGAVIGIDNTAVVKLSAKGSEERLVKVIIKPDQQDEFKTGYDVDVKFSYYREEHQLMVPKSALYEENGNSMVLMVENNTLKGVEVQKGPELRSEILIESGLSEGSIIASDTAGLKQGLKVKTDGE